MKRPIGRRTQWPTDGKLCLATMLALLPLFLYVPFFLTSNIARQAEYVQTLRLNLQGPAQRVYLISENSTALKLGLLVRHQKLHTLQTSHRPLFRDAFDAINRIGATRRHIAILLNADIFLDPATFADTLARINSTSAKVALALTRWTVAASGDEPTHYGRSDSQDTWIFPPGGVRCTHAGDFRFGVPGCDNRLVAQLDECGYVVRNPSLSLRTLHLHTSAIRTYTTKDIVRGKRRELTPTQLVPSALQTSGAPTVDWHSALCGAPERNLRVQPIGPLDLLISSMGGVGSSGLFSALKDVAPRTNAAGNEDRYKHAPHPPADANTTLALFVFGSPARSVASLFRRDYHALHSQTITDNACHVPAHWSLERYTAHAEDAFRFSEQLSRWLHTPTAYTTLFLNTVHLTPQNSHLVVRRLCQLLGRSDGCFQWSWNSAKRRSDAPPDALLSMYASTERRVRSLPMLFARQPHSRLLSPTLAK